MTEPAVLSRRDVLTGAAAAALALAAAPARALAAVQKWLTKDQITAMYQHMDRSHYGKDDRFSVLRGLPRNQLMQLIGDRGLATIATTFDKISNRLLGNPKAFYDTVKYNLDPEYPARTALALNAMRNFIVFNKGRELVQAFGSRGDALVKLQESLLESLLHKGVDYRQNDRKDIMVLTRLADLVARHGNAALRQHFTNNFGIALTHVPNQGTLRHALSTVQGHYQAVLSGSEETSPLALYLPQGFSPADARNAKGKIVAVTVLGDFENRADMDRDYNAIMAAFKKDGWTRVNGDGFIIMTKGDVTHLINKPDAGVAGIGKMKAHANSMGGTSIAIQRGHSRYENFSRFQDFVRNSKNTVKLIVLGGCSFGGEQASDIRALTRPDVQVVENKMDGQTGTNNRLVLGILNPLASNKFVNWAAMAAQFGKQLFPIGDLTRAMVLKIQNFAGVASPAPQQPAEGTPIGGFFNPPGSFHSITTTSSAPPSTPVGQPVRLSPYAYPPLPAQR